MLDATRRARLMLRRGGSTPSHGVPAPAQIWAGNNAESNRHSVRDATKAAATNISRWRSAGESDIPQSCHSPHI